MKNGRCIGLMVLVDDIDAWDEVAIMVLEENQVMRTVHQRAAPLNFLPGDTGDQKRSPGEPGVKGVHHEIHVKKHVHQEIELLRLPTRRTG